VAAAAAAAYASPPRAQAPPGSQRQPLEPQWQRAASPPTPRAPPPPPPAPPPPPQRPQEQHRDRNDNNDDAQTSPFTLGPIPAAVLSAFYDAVLRLALRLSGLSDAVWARAMGGSAGAPGPSAARSAGATAAPPRPPASGSSVSAPRLALALNGALARLVRSSQACLGVAYLKPSLREIATLVRAVEAGAGAGSESRGGGGGGGGGGGAPFGPPSLSRQDADAALALCLRHSLPTFARAFWRRYAVPAATGALAVGLARDLFLPLLPLLLRLLASAALLSPLSPFLSGPLLGFAVACGAQVHGDPLWAAKRSAAWARERAAAFAGGGGSGAAPSPPPPSSSAFGGAGDAAEGAADGGWADGAADVDMVDELLAEASAYLDALQRRQGGGACPSGDAGGASAVAADLGARVLKALRRRRRDAAGAAGAAGAAE